MVDKNQDEDEDRSADVEAASITLLRAIQIAAKKIGARAVESEILLLPGRTVIEVKLLRDEKKLFRVDVDAHTGEWSVERKRRHAT